MFRSFVKIVLLYALVPTCAIGQVSEKTYTFGVVPQLSASKVAAQWVPLLRRVSRESGVSLDFMTAKSIAKYEEGLLGEKYDFAYMSSLLLKKLSEEQKYRPFARSRDKRVQGVLVVPIESQITDIRSLQGKILAFPAPNALGATLLIKHLLRKAGVTHQSNYVRSHQSVYTGVSKNLHVAGGGIAKTFEMFSKGKPQSLRVIARTKSFFPHPFTVRTALPEEVTEKIADAFLRLSSDNEGKKLLAAIGIGAVVKADESDWAEDWNDFEAMDIDDL